MTGRFAVLVAVALLLVAGLAGAASGATDGTRPELSVAVDSKPVDDGDEYGTKVDPTLDVEASVGTNASASRTLTEVVVRVNGDLYRNFSTGGRNFSKSVTLDVETGENTVRVIATDDRDRATSTTFTVIKDDRRPAAYLTEPYGTTPYVPIRDGAVNGSWTTFDVTVLDFSAVPKVDILHRWNDTDDSHRKTTAVTDIDGNFSQRLFLGLGTNRLQFTVEDEFDNTKIYRFDVNVTDAAAPNVTLDPYPTRINDSEFVLSGRVTDDVWVDKARIIATQVDGDERIKKHILRSANYHVDPARVNTSFEKSLYFHEAGTYRVNVTLRDVANRTTTRSFRVERLPDDELAVAPEISVNRDRTVVLDSETLFVDGLASDGQIRRLVVETRQVPTDRTIGYHRIYSGTNRQRVAFDRNVTIEPGLTKVIVRAIDANGVEHAERFFVNGTSRETFVGNTSARTRGQSNASVSLTRLAGGGVGVASASAQVTGGEAGTRVAVEGPEPVAETANVTVERVAVGLREDANFTLGVTVRDRAAGVLPAPVGARPAAATAIEHSLSAEQVSDATLTVAVRRSYLADGGFDPANLTAHRLSGGEWTAVDATRTGANGTHVRYRVDSPGLSVFTLAAPKAAPDDADATADDGTVDGTADRNVTEPDSAADDTESTGGNGTDEPAGTADVSVENVTVNTTTVAPGDRVAINATLRNEGDADGEYVAGLRVFDLPNVSFPDRRTVTVPAGDRRTVTFVHQFNETGTYNVSVNGTRAESVAVEGGGLLSVFSVVPVRLLGLGLAGIVGLLVVVLLARAVLRRVGGETSE